MKNYSTRHDELNVLFKLGENCILPDSGIQIVFDEFKSDSNYKTTELNNDKVFTDNIEENSDFLYPVFLPKGEAKSNKLIILLHGLNERYWNKYLSWAEYLCENTGKAVLLFPIAYHMNRSPLNWANPRYLKMYYDYKMEREGNDRSISFANLALSERIFSKPERFLKSGKQSFDDLVALTETVRNGNHQYIEKGASIDFFAYSIGAFLSQILFLANPKNLFSESKLFLFCGGSVFSRMWGESRNIMDKKAFERLYSYYEQDYKPASDNAEQAFDTMLAPERNQKNRLDFFRFMGKRISGISLSEDKVIPFQGIKEALGEDVANDRIGLFELTYKYTHENPFPIFKNQMKEEVDKSFLSIFRQAAHFLN